MQTSLLTRADARNNGSAIKDAIRRFFNATGRAHILSGHRIIPVMETDGSIRNYKVEEVKAEHGYAVLSHDGATFGVIFDA